MVHFYLGLDSFMEAANSNVAERKRLLKFLDFIVSLINNSHDDRLLPVNSPILLKNNLVSMLI